MGLIPEGTTTLLVRGREIQVDVRRSRKARRIRFRVLSGGIELVLPVRDRTSLRRIVGSSEAWLDKAWGTLELRRGASGDAETVWVRGERQRLDKLGVCQGEFVRRTVMEARLELPRTVAEVAMRTGLVPVKVAVRNQSSRWGSCSRRGTVSLNWRLLMAPDWVAEYVIVHELCHLRHMDHSADFWRLVETHFPEQRAAKAWLKAHGHELMRLQVGQGSG